MSEELENKSGRPPESKTIENITEENTATSIKEDDTLYEFNSFQSQNIFNTNDFLYSCGVYSYFDKETINCVLKSPVVYHEEAIRLSNFIYTKNGIISNSIDYMTALPCLDRIITYSKVGSEKKIKKNKELMLSVLKKIDDKKFIRDGLHTEMREGTAFYYFDVRKKTSNLNKYMTDYDVDSIFEINEAGMNVSIITLPWNYTKIVGKKNGRYILAFNLRYFDKFDENNRSNKLRKYPEEISKAYNDKRKKNIQTNGDWLILDNDKTMCCKIKCKDSEPWGRSLIIAALEDVLYKDYFTDTKRNVLDEVNNKIIYETFPEADKKGVCALSKLQQQNQHDTVKTAIMNKNNRGGTSFFSVAAGTKLDTIDVNFDIFDSKNESDLNNSISMDMGICASLIGAMTTGNFASSQNNLEMITAQLYTWVYEWQNELNYVINKNIIKDEQNRVEIYYFPTSFVNRKSFFEMMEKLYLSAGGSLNFYIASTGIDPEVYLSVLDQEIKDGFFEKYKPHQTSYTLSKNTENKNGRPTIDNPTNENTLVSKTNNSNSLPKPSNKN